MQSRHKCKDSPSYRAFRELAERRLKVETNAFAGAFEGQASNEEDGEHNVGENRRKVDNLLRKQKHKHP